MRSEELVREYGLDEVGWSYRIGDLADHLDRQRSDRRPGLVRHPLWQPQHLNEVHQLRPLDDPPGVIPRPTRPG
jgi:glycine betaine/proline transport system substrate-binding protein